MGTHTRASVKALSLFIWSICVVILGIHGGCGGGTSGTGVKALVTGQVLTATQGEEIELLDPSGEVIASVQLGVNGNWSVDLPEGTAISAVRYGNVANPLPQFIVVSAAVTTALMTSPVAQTTTATQVSNPTPTPTQSSGGGIPTPPPVPTDTPRTRPTATPTIDPTAYCAANPQRPACFTPTPTPTNTRPPRATATPTIDPTAYCATHPNRPLCATPTPTPTP